MPGSRRKIWITWVLRKTRCIDLYCMYYRADKMVEEMTQGQNLEVSDAEAKVIEIQQIRLDTREEAEEVLTLAQEEGADFASLGARYSTDSQLARSMEWSEEMDALGEAAFALEQDAVSGIVEQDGGILYFEMRQCLRPGGYCGQEGAAGSGEEERGV